MRTLISLTLSNTLKKTNIDSLKELLELMQRGTSYTETFVSARHLENVWDWKSFIMLHLLTRGDTIIRITFPHHMRFYMENGVIRVQYKHFSKDSWGTYWEACMLEVTTKHDGEASTSIGSPCKGEGVEGAWRVHSIQDEMYKEIIKYRE